MSEQLPPEEEQQELEDEQLSSTLLGGLTDSLRRFGQGFGGVASVIVLVGVVALVLGMVIFAFFEDLKLYSYIVMGVGGLLLLFSLIISFPTVSEAVTGRRGRYTTNTTLMIAAFIGIAAVGNFLAIEITARMDVTATKQFDLAPRTRSLLGDLQGDVYARAFFPESNIQPNPNLDAFRGQMDDILREFSKRSGKFDYEFIDPVIEPGIATEYGVTRAPTIVFEAEDSGQRHQVPLSTTWETFLVRGLAPIEQSLVTGLLIVTGQEQKQVYFLTGHGERELTALSENPEGYSVAASEVQAENYRVSTLNLFNAIDRERLQASVGEGSVSLLVIAGPKEDLQVSDVVNEPEELHNYMRNGGNLLFLADPATKPRFREFIARWGINMEEGHIVDSISNYDPARSQNIKIGQNQYICTGFDSVCWQTNPDFFPIFPGITSVTGGVGDSFYPDVAALVPNEDIPFTPRFQQGESDEPVDSEKLSANVFGVGLTLTTPRFSWTSLDPDSNDPTADSVVGPFFTMLALRALAPLDEELPSDPAEVASARIIAIGDSDFASNSLLFASGNRDVFLNSINWLVGDEPLASIRPRAQVQRFLNPTDTERKFIRWSGYLLLPALMAITGGVVWWRRR